MISILIPNLRGGGAEKIVVNLANSWVSMGYKVELVLMERRGHLLGALNDDIKIYSLDCKRFRGVPYALAQYLRRNQPEVILAHMWPLTSLAVLSWFIAGQAGKLFLCEHVGLSCHVKRDLRLPIFFVQTILRLGHSRATGVIAVSEGVANDLAVLAGLPKQRVHTIYNPVVDNVYPKALHHVDLLTKRKLWNGSFRTHLVTVGTLKEQKNHRLLLKAFVEVAHDLDAALVILGEGHLRSILEQDIVNLGLVGRVIMPGFFEDPSPWYKAADLFVLSSDFEGLPTVLIEALAYGTPIVSTNCPHGPAEILEHGYYGLLVPLGDSDALADAMRAACNCSWKPASLQERALDFSITRQARAYLQLFQLL